MRSVILVALCALFFACNPYRQIAGDYGNRKPFERDILLQEADREVPKKAIKDVPPPTFDSTSFKNYIATLEEGLKNSQGELDYIANYADSLYKDNADYQKLKAVMQKKASDYEAQIKALKNAPPVIKKEPVPWENTAQIELLNGSVAKLKQDVYERERIISDAKADKEKAEEARKAAEKYKWMFFGLIWVLVLAIAFLFLRKFRIV